MSISAKHMYDRVSPAFVDGDAYFGLYYAHPVIYYGMGDNGEISGDGYANFNLAAANWERVYTAPNAANGFQGSLVMSNLAAFNFTPTAVWPRVLYLAVRHTNASIGIIWYRPAIEPIPLLQPDIPLNIAIGGLQIIHRDI